MKHSSSRCFFATIVLLLVFTCPPPISPIVVMFSRSGFSTTPRIASFFYLTFSAESKRDFTSGKQEMIVAWQYPPLA
jgi:hypothetical protein